MKKGKKKKKRVHLPTDVVSIGDGGFSVMGKHQGFMLCGIAVGFAFGIEDIFLAAKGEKKKKKKKRLSEEGGGWPS